MVGSGWASIDKLKNIENIHGSAYGDTLTDAGQYPDGALHDVLRGGGGADRLYGGAVLTGCSVMQAMIILLAGLARICWLAGGG